MIQNAAGPENLMVVGSKSSQEFKGNYSAFFKSVEVVFIDVTVYYRKIINALGCKM